MKRKFMVEILHHDDPSGGSNLYVTIMAKNEFIARKMVERMYRNDYRRYVSTAWEPRS